jgi:hypothetical protein
MRRSRARPSLTRFVSRSVLSCPFYGVTPLWPAGGGRRRAVEQIAETMPEQYSSTAQDLARGKPSEIDYLNGYIVRKGDELNVPTPANRMLYTLVKLIEARVPSV